jgi:hypothetical protein
MFCFHCVLRKVYYVACYILGTQHTRDHIHLVYVPEMTDVHILETRDQHTRIPETSFRGKLPETETRNPNSGFSNPRFRPKIYQNGLGRERECVF